MCLQPVITRDNVEISVHPMLMYKISDPIRAVYETYDLPDCVEKLVQVCCVGNRTNRTTALNHKCRHTVLLPHTDSNHVCFPLAFLQFYFCNDRRLCALLSEIWVSMMRWLLGRRSTARLRGRSARLRSTGALKSRRSIFLKFIPRLRFRQDRLLFDEIDHGIIVTDCTASYASTARCGTYPPCCDRIC